MRKKTGKQVAKADNMPLSGDLTADIRKLIETARHNVAVTVNTGLTLLYWQIGSRIRQDILNEKRAEYGEGILPTLSAKLVPEFGNGFSIRNLSRMIRFVEITPLKDYPPPVRTPYCVIKNPGSDVIRRFQKML